MDSAEREIIHESKRKTRIVNLSAIFMIGFAVFVTFFLDVPHSKREDAYQRFYADLAISEFFTIMIWALSSCLRHIFLGLHEYKKSISIETNQKRFYYLSVVYKVLFYFSNFVFYITTIYQILAFGFFILSPILTTDSPSLLSIIISVSLFLFVARTFLALILPPPIKIKRFFSKIFAKK